MRSTTRLSTRLRTPFNFPCVTAHPHRPSLAIGALAAALLALTPPVRACDVIAVAAGSTHSLALTSGGSLYAWGQNDSGQLGVGDRSDQCGPTRVVLSDIIAVAAGGVHTLALESDGTVWAWGSNRSGQLGLGCGPIDELVPIEVPNLLNVTAIAAGAHFSLALRADGTVWGWGDDAKGQLGLDPATLPGRISPTPVQVVGLTSILAIAAGHEHALALAADGTVYAWGYDGAGQLGRGGPPVISPFFLFTPAQVQLASTLAPLVGVTAIAAGASHSLALVADGGVVMAWGEGAEGELGNGLSISSPYAVPAGPFGLPVRTISAGARHSLAVTNDGRLWGWGSNRYSELANGPSTFERAPVLVLDSSVQLDGVQLIAAGGHHSLALQTGRALRAWGGNERRQLGAASATPVVTIPEFACAPCPSTLLRTAAGGYHSVAIVLDSTVAAWGRNLFGQLGDGSVADSPRAVTVRVDPSGPTELRGAIAVAAGDSHSLALLVDGTVWAWGRNNEGQLGQGTTAGQSAIAVQVQDSTGFLQGVIAIAVGGEHSLALKADGTVWAWGSNSDGQLGDGSILRASGRPVPVASASLKFRAIAAGGLHSLAIAAGDGGSPLAGGTVWTWGDNLHGQLGDGTFGDRNVPVPVLENALLDQLMAIAEVAGGARFSYARAADGATWVWGDNDGGVLEADPTLLDASEVALPTTFSWAKAIAAGAAHSLTIDAAGLVWALGDNSSGQLGIDCSTGRSFAFVAVEVDPPPFPSYLGGANQVAGGGPKLGSGADGAHSLAWTTDNQSPDPSERLARVASWGANQFGQLGLGPGHPDEVCASTPFPRVPDPLPPDQGNVLLAAKDATRLDVVLSWTGAPGPDEYRVYVYQGAAKKRDVGDPNKPPVDLFLPAPPLVITVDTFTHVGVVAGSPRTLWFYRFRALSHCYHDSGD